MKSKNIRSERFQSTVTIREDMRIDRLADKLGGVSKPALLYKIIQAGIKTLEERNKPQREAPQQSSPEILEKMTDLEAMLEEQSSHLRFLRTVDNTQAIEKIMDKGTRELKRWIEWYPAYEAKVILGSNEQYDLNLSTIKAEEFEAKRNKGGES